MSQYSVQHHSALKSSYIDIYTFSFCFFFCFTKAVLHKAATFGNYPVCISIYKMISVLSHTSRCSQTHNPVFLSCGLSVSLFFSLPHLLPLLICTRREKCRLSYVNFQNFPRDIYQLSFLLNLMWIRKRKSTYIKSPLN